MRQRLAHQTTENEFTPAIAAQYTVSHVLRGGARYGRLIGQHQQGFAQTLSCTYHGQYTSGKQQAPAKRIRR